MPPFIGRPTAANQNLITSSLDLDYAKGFKGAKPWSKEIVAEKSSSGRIVVIPWAEPAKKFERFQGEWKVNPYVLDATSAKCEPWQNWLGIDRNDAFSVQYGLLQGQAEDMGYQAAKLSDDWTALALRNGGASFNNYLWYDGLSVFNAAHPVNPHVGVASGIWKNLFTVTPLTLDNIIAVWNSMASTIKLPNGRLLDVRPNKLLCSGANFLKAKELLKTDYFARALNAASGATSQNWLNGLIEPVDCPELGEQGGNEALTWYLMDDRRFKPINCYYLQKPRVIPLVNDSDAFVQANNSWFYKGEADGCAVVWGAWFIARCEPV